MITDQEHGYINPIYAASWLSAMTSIEALLYSALYAYAALGLGYVLSKIRNGGLDLEP